MRCKRSALWMSVITLLLMCGLIEPAIAADVQYRYATVAGSRIFYREAGDPASPVVLLLHGFPSSSHMFRDLIPALAAHFHVIAPDYPGMGNSDSPAAGAPPLTFDAVAQTMDAWLRQSGIQRAVLYLQDFGGPVGMRLATRHPSFVRGLVIQNTPLSLDGWQPARLKAVQANAGPETPEKRAAAETRVVLATDMFLYRQGARNPDGLSPDAWQSDAAALGDPQKRRAMTDLQLDICSNLALYPQWQHYLSIARPRTLVVWGDGDPIFVPAGADAIKRYVPTAQVVHYRTGHFALEEEHADIARRIIAAFGDSRR